MSFSLFQMTTGIYRSRDSRAPPRYEKGKCDHRHGGDGKTAQSRIFPGTERALRMRAGVLALQRLQDRDRPSPLRAELFCGKLRLSGDFHVGNRG